MDSAKYCDVMLYQQSHRLCVTSLCIQVYVFKSYEINLIEIALYNASDGDKM
jgi:hypothetical protein